MIVVELYIRDVPGLWHPPGVDILQVLWCPFAHDHGRTPTLRLFWRREDTTPPIADPPTGLTDERFYVPKPCVLHPELVTEYPDLEDLPTEMRDEVELLGAQIDYVGELSTAPGWKVAGWPQWSVTGAHPIECATCGTQMDLLLTIDTTEHEAGSRWEPVDADDRDLRAERREPTGIVIGRWGSLQVFACTRWRGHPARFDLQ
jgi:hypothetical protein